MELAEVLEAMPDFGCTFDDDDPGSRVDILEKVVTDRGDDSDSEDKECLDSSEGTTAETQLSDESNRPEADQAERSTPFSLKNVTVTSPDGRVLVRKLNLDLTLGRNVLIMGRSSAGKSSLLRVLRGLWPPGRGSHLTKSCQSQVLFLPQRPFFTDGSLREQLTYPCQSDNDRHAEEDREDWLLQELVRWDLTDLLARYGTSSRIDAYIHCNTCPLHLQM